MGLKTSKGLSWDSDLSRVVIGLKTCLGLSWDSDLSRVVMVLRLSRMYRVGIGHKIENDKTCA